MAYHSLLKQAHTECVNVYERILPSSIKGLYSDGTIWINQIIPTQVEKACVLAEELGHYYTSSGDILDQQILLNRKQENRAKNWAYEKMVPLTAITKAHKTGIRNRHELADLLSVTEEFLEQAIKYYLEKHGLYIKVEGFTICFEPLGVIEMFE